MKRHEEEGRWVSGEALSAGLAVARGGAGRPILVLYSNNTGRCGISGQLHSRPAWYRQAMAGRSKQEFGTADERG